MKIQVIGAGSWGLALAQLLSSNGHAISLWCRDAGVAARLSDTRERPEMIPGLKLAENVEVSTGIAPDIQVAVWVVPSHALRQIARELPIPRGVMHVSCVKGIEAQTLCRMSEVLAQTVPAGPVVALSGPSHAEEVAHGLPASVVAASADVCAAVETQELFFAPSLRVYTSPDIVGVELGGAVKNVIAIAAGACDGLGLGDNAKAALITRGLAEIARLGAALGADPITFAGLSGMGDLIGTCASRHSRNRAVGEGVARGRRAEDILGGNGMVAEGVRTAASTLALAECHGVEMPITRAVNQVLFEGRSPREAVTELMSRAGKEERA